MSIKSFFVFYFFLTLCTLSVAEGFPLASQAGTPDSYICGRDVRLRSTAALNGSVLGMLEYGTAVIVLEKSSSQTTVNGHSDYWYKIFLDPEWVELDAEYKTSGIKGWVFGQFLKRNEIFDYQKYFDTLDWHGKPMPELFNKILENGFSWMSDDYFPEYIAPAGLGFGKKSFNQRYDGGGGVGDWRYEIISISQPDSKTLSISMRNMGTWGSEEGTDIENLHILRAPFPAQIFSVTVTAYGYMDSIFISGLPFNVMNFNNDASTEITLYNSSPGCYKVLGDNVRLRYSEVYGVYGEHSFTEDSIMGYANKGDILFNLNDYGFRNSVKETISGKTDYWYYLNVLDSTTTSWVFGGFIAPATMEEIVSYLDNHNVWHPDQPKVKGEVFSLVTEKGKRTFTMGPGYILFKEPNGDETLWLFKSKKVRGEMKNNVTEFSYKNILQHFNKNMQRGGKVYQGSAYSHEILCYDWYNQSFSTRYYPQGYSYPYIESQWKLEK